MVKLKLLYINILVSQLCLVACQASKVSQVDTSSKATEAQITQQLGNAVLWYRYSAEMRALFYQTYEYAKMRLDKKLASNPQRTKKAIVLDIDETILDNSPFEVKRFDSGTTYTLDNWKEWTLQERAESLPGALDFVNYAKEKGLEVFYISNRTVSELEATLANLSAAGFPFADEQHVLLNATTSDKTARRSIVDKDFDIMLFLGDNLTDYSQLYADREEGFGKELVDSQIADLLDNFIMFPNPMYGEWEKAIYHNNYRIPNKEKLKHRLDLLKADY